jgi:hypothetical protein
MYLSVLGREPDPEGFSYYTSQPVENLRQSFYQASLPEMEKRVGAIDVTTTIPTPVIGQRSEPTAQELYLGLGRAPDPAGLAFYENYSGPNREAAFATGAAEKGEQYDPTKPMTIGLPGQTTTTSLSGMTPQQRDLSRLMVSKMPQPVSETTTAPSVFSPENVAAQLELERLRLQPTPEPPAETPVAGFAQGGLVNDDINRMLQNQRNAVMRESQSRRMLTNLGAPPVKKFSDGGPAGSSSGVRRLKMSGYQKGGGDVTDEMFVGTAPSEESQQTTGEYIKGLYKENIPVHARVYLETLLGKKDPITAEDFTKDELARIDSLIQKTEAERLGKTLKNQADLQSSLERTIKRLSSQKDIAKKMVEDPDWIAYGELDKKPTSPEVANERFDAWTRFYNKFADQAFVHEDITLIMGDRDPKKVQSYLDEKKQKNKQTTEYLKDRLSKVNQALDSVQGKGLKGAVDDYSAYGSTSPEEMEDTDISRTLGRFNYETLPSGRRVVKDTYDFYNEYRAPMVEEYEKMGPAKKALSVLLEAVKDPVQLPSVLGNAYIGRDGRPVKVEYDPKDLPVKRQDGSPSQGEISDDMFVGTRPEDFPETSAVDKKAGELLRALSEGTRGFVGAEPIEAGSEAYRTGQALANMPAVGVVAATAKGAGKAKDALKSIVDPARLFEEVEKIPRNQVIDDLRSAHIGGVGDFGDSDAKYYFSQIPGGKEYIKKSQQVAKKNLGDRFMGYRLMSKDQFEDLQAGDVGDLLSFTLDQNTAEALRNFVTNQKRTDLVVAEVPLTPKHIVAFGHPGEKEIIVDTGVGWSIDEFKQASPLKKAKGGEVTNDEFIQEMMTGTPMSDTTTSPGILPPEIRQAVDVPLDFANLLIRGTAAVPIGGAAGLYKGITGGKYGTQEGVKEADTEAARMMAKITGEPKTQAAKDVLEFIGGKAQEYKLDAALPQLLTLPSPGPGAASALMRSYELAETPPSGVVKMPGGNWLKGQVEYFVRPLKKDIPWTQGQLEEMPGVAKAEAPNLALNKFIETGLTRYIKNDMASAKDTLRNLADENTIKAGKAYNNDLRQVKKAYDRAEKIKAEGPRPNMLPGTWENAIEAQLGRARQLEEEANRKLNLELRHALPFPVLQEDGELAGGLNFHMRRNLQTGGKETLVSSRKEAGQAEEGVAQTPTGKVWETMADLFVKPQAAGQITDQDYFMRSTDSQRVLRNNPWLATVPPETPVYIPQDVFRSSSFLNSFSPDDLGFKHITDELANAMNPGSGLPANLLLTPDEVANMGMEKAARHVIEVNKWREEQMGVANALRAQKSISLYKDYPTIPGKTEPNQRGLQWLELKLMPEDDTPESMVKAKEALADALKYEGEVMGHCVGGECPKVESGKSRIISLRDAKGEPHVTLEVIPPEVNFSDVLGGNPAFPNRDPELYRMMDTMTTTQIEKTPLYKEKAAAIAAQKLPGISQIKGKGNNRPPDSYQPFITDFIASQQWSSVGDLQNTNLVRIEPMILKNAQDRGFNPQIVTTIKERPYITKEEFNRLADLFGGMNKYAAGGEVTDFIKRAA